MNDEVATDEAATTPGARPRSIRLSLMVSVLMVLIGVLTWLTMPKQEDPDLPDRWAALIGHLPGASPEEIEVDLAVPVEQALQEVDHIRDIESTSRSGVLVLTVELEDVYDVDQHWERVREAVGRVELPRGAWFEPLDTRLTQQESIVVALTGSDDVVRLSDAAEHLRRRLLAHPRVRAVERAGTVEPEVVIELAPARARMAGLEPGAVAATLRLHTGVHGVGSVDAGGLDLGIRVLDTPVDVDDLREIELVARDGSLVRLGDVATVERRAPPRPRERVRHDGELAVTLGVVAEVGIDIVDFGQEIAALVDEAEPELGGLQATLVVDQPQRVAARLADLERSLMMSTLIVAVVLLVFMGPRLAILCAVVVPLALLSAVGLFGLGGGVLHQISLAGGIISIGMVVDNTIVVVEEVQRRLDAGEPGMQAARAAVRSLFKPLLASTATTVAAFLPMLINTGTTADFTRAIPIMVILALAMSFVFSMWVLAPSAGLMLRRRRTQAVAAHGRLERGVGWLLRRPALALLPGLVLIGAAVMTGPDLATRFFPPTNRNQAVIELKVQEGSSVESTAEVSAGVEAEALTLPYVQHVEAYLGRGVPHFYYNLPETPVQANFGQLLVHLDRGEDVAALERHFTRWAEESAPPGLELRVLRLKQGPPAVAPIEILLYSSELGLLREAARRVSRRLDDVDGLWMIRNTIDGGAPNLVYDVDGVQVSALSHELGAASSRDEGTAVAEGTAAALASRIHGIDAGTLLRYQRHERVVVRPASADDPMELLGDATLPDDTTRVDESTRRRLRWLPASITRKQQRRFARVTAQLEPGWELSDVLGTIRDEMADAAARSPVDIALAGEVQSAEEANDALLKVVPVGLGLLLIVLMWEFDSFRCVALVLLTIPLAVIGVIPALVLAREPFGFMCALGAVALIGVVVNNAIVLLDLALQLRDEGMSSREAFRQATMRRLRPVLLTTVTTVAGLVPLLISNTTLWPPMALTMISGLTSSTILTILTLPAMGILAFDGLRSK